MYVKEDIIGAASRITYAKQGDYLIVLRRDLDLSLVEFNNQRFFVRNEKLTEKKVDPAPEVVGESTKGIQRSRKGKR